MDTRLVRGGLVVGGYLFVGRICWQSAAHDADIFGEGPYLHGHKYGTVLAINGDARDDGHGAFSCVFLRVKKDSVQDDCRVTPNDEQEIEIAGEIKMKGVTDLGIVLMHDPNSKYEVFLQDANASEEAIRRIKTFCDNHGLILNEKM